MSRVSNAVATSLQVITTYSGFHSAVISLTAWTKSRRVGYRDLAMGKVSCPRSSSCGAESHRSALGVGKRHANACRGECTPRTRPSLACQRRDDGPGRCLPLAATARCRHSHPPPPT